MDKYDNLLLYFIHCFRNRERFKINTSSASVLVEVLEYLLSVVFGNANKMFVYKRFHCILFKSFIRGENYKLFVMCLLKRQYLLKVIPDFINVK